MTQTELLVEWITSLHLTEDEQESLFDWFTRILSTRGVGEFIFPEPKLSLTTSVHCPHINPLLYSGASATTTQGVAVGKQEPTFDDLIDEYDATIHELYSIRRALEELTK
jgi:hypothetical protein